MAIYHLCVRKKLSEAEMARKNKENADGLRSYNALKGRVAELEKRMDAALEGLTTQCQEGPSPAHQHQLPVEHALAEERVVVAAVRPAQHVPPREPGRRDAVPQHVQRLARGLPHALVGAEEVKAVQGVGLHRGVGGAVELVPAAQVVVKLSQCTHCAMPAARATAALGPSASSASPSRIRSAVFIRKMLV